MNTFRNARLAAREVWQRSRTDPLLSVEELKQLELAMSDLEHAYRAHSDAAAKKRREELERVAS